MANQPPSTQSSNNVVGVHYKVGKKIGEGSFGIIYEGMELFFIFYLYYSTLFWHIFISGTNLLNNKQVAIKFEPRKSDAPQLRDEYRTYKMMAGSGIVQKKKRKYNPRLF